MKIAYLLYDTKNFQYICIIKAISPMINPILLGIESNSIVSTINIGQQPRQTAFLK